MVTVRFTNLDTGMQVTHTATQAQANLLITWFSNMREDDQHFVVEVY